MIISICWLYKLIQHLHICSFRHREMASNTFFHFPLHCILIVISYSGNFEQQYLFIWKLLILFSNNYILNTPRSVFLHQKPRENEANREPTFTFWGDVVGHRSPQLGPFQKRLCNCLKSTINLIILQKSGCCDSSKQTHN